MKEFGFTRVMRLVDPADFKRVFGAGKRVSARAFTVLCCSNGLAYPRLGLAISRKHLSRSVDRNRIKRLIRESFRHWQQTLKGLDLVVLSKPGIGQYSNSDLRRCLEFQWLRLIRIQEWGNS
jgi:ribonuclease P protein component